MIGSTHLRCHGEGEKFPINNVNNVEAQAQLLFVVREI